MSSHNTPSTDVDPDTGAGVRLARDPRSEWPFPLSAEVPASIGFLDEFTTEFSVPFDAEITRIMIESDKAAQQGVGVRIGTGGGSVWIPKGGQTNVVGSSPQEPKFIPAPTQPLTFYPNVELSKDAPVVCQFANNDSDESHWVTAIIFIREQEDFDE